MLYPNQCYNKMCYSVWFHVLVNSYGRVEMVNFVGSLTKL